MADHGTSAIVPPGQRARVLAARLRPVLLVVALVAVLGPAVGDWFGLATWDLPGPVVVVLMATGLVPSFLPALVVESRPRDLRPPVRGRWAALNSPASRTPSHGTLAYGQSHAVDLVLDPAAGGRPGWGTGAGFRSPSDYPAFGAPVLAPADGLVVAAPDWRRDHRSRSHWWTLPWLVVEGMVRELGGPGWVLGNHVVLRLDDATHVVLAHLRRGSATVTAGDRVSAGDPLGEVGNSGNSTEPHLHVQRMDHHRPSIAAGLPFALVGARLEGEAVDGIPTTGAHLVA